MKSRLPLYCCFGAFITVYLKVCFGQNTNYDLVHVDDHVSLPSSLQAVNF